jgi:histone H3/H4
MSLSITPRNGVELSKIAVVLEAVLEANDIKLAIRDGSLFNIVREAFEAEQVVTKSMIQMCSLTELAESMVDEYKRDTFNPEDLEYLRRLAQFAIDTTYDIEGGESIIEAIAFLEN